MRVRPVVVDDLPSLPEIERAADGAFVTGGMPEIGEYHPRSADELAAFLTGGGLGWVAVDADERVVAFLVAEPVDGSLHVEQISVHPRVARQGIGRRLLDHAGDAALGRGFAALTLTTFAEVPWNAPYYERCGFVRLSDDALTPGLAAIRAAEARHGLDRWPRVCMRRSL